MTSTPTIFVTGGTGRTGPHLLQKLVAKGYTVRAVSSRPAAELASRARPGIEWVQMDWTKTIDFTGMLEGCAAVLHLGAEIHDASRMQRINVEATAALGQAAEQAGVRFVCYTSSAAVYGAPARRLVTEMTPTVTAECEIRHEYLGSKAARAYARTKLLGEKALSSRARACEYVILRPTMVTTQDDLGEQLQAGAKRRVLAGRRRTQQLHVDDFVHAIVWFMERSLARKTPIGDLQVFNLADDEAGTVADVFARAHRITRDPRYRRLPAVPTIVDRVGAMIKFRNLRLRHPFGMVHYSTEKLRASGYRHALGIEAAQDRLLGLLSRPTVQETV